PRRLVSTALRRARPAPAPVFGPYSLAVSGARLRRAVAGRRAPQPTAQPRVPGRRTRRRARAARGSHSARGLAVRPPALSIRAYTPTRSQASRRKGPGTTSQDPNHLGRGAPAEAGPVPL